MRNPMLVAALAGAGVFSFGQSNQVAGLYMEDRSSRVYGCPCEWSSETVQSGREAVLAWFIQSGEFGGRSLAGLKLAAVLVGEASLSEPMTPRSATLFLDEAAPPPKRRAGEAWLRARYGDLIGRVLALHMAPVELGFTENTVDVRIRGVLRMQMRRASLVTDTETWASLLYEPFIELFPATLGSTLRTEYTAPDLRRKWRREETAITGYYGRFTAR